MDRKEKSISRGLGKLQTNLDALFKSASPAMPVVLIDIIRRSSRGEPGFQLAMFVLKMKSIISIVAWRLA